MAARSEISQTLLVEPPVIIARVSRGVGCETNWGLEVASKSSASLSCQKESEDHASGLEQAGQAQSAFRRLQLFPGPAPPD
jgi:hypothetical protein